MRARGRVPRKKKEKKKKKKEEEEGKKKEEEGKKKEEEGPARVGRDSIGGGGQLPCVNVARHALQLGDCLHYCGSVNKALPRRWTQSQLLRRRMDSKQELSSAAASSQRGPCQRKK